MLINEERRSTTKSTISFKLNNKTNKRKVILERKMKKKTFNLPSEFASRGDSLSTDNSTIRFTVQQYPECPDGNENNTIRFKIFTPLLTIPGRMIFFSFLRAVPSRPASRPAPHKHGTLRSTLYFTCKVTFIRATRYKHARRTLRRTVSSGPPCTARS